MDLFIWDPEKYSVGIQEMDDEHKILIAIMNRLYNRNGCGAPVEELNKIIDELVAYTQKHFSDEEEYMQKVNYPEIRTHHALHLALFRELQKHIDEFRKGHHQIRRGFFDFLTAWLVAHINGVDKKYGPKPHHIP